MKTLLLMATVSLMAMTVAQAQVPIQVVVPAGVQQNPAGFYNLNNGVWFGDRVGGVLCYVPDDPTNTNPLDTGTYHAAPDDGCTVKGIAGSLFASFNYIGQISRISDTLALLAVPDTGKLANGKPVGGVWTLSFDPNAVPPVPPTSNGNQTQLVPDKGLAGPQATSVALGPDGKIYFGNLKNGNIQRISGVNVESVGTAPNGQPVLSLAFLGSDLFYGSGDGFYKIPNATACFANHANCARPTLIAGGSTVAVAGDGCGHVYYAQAIGTASRFDVVSGAIIPLASGLSFGSVTAGLGLDRNGNLWIGQNSEIDRILAVNLPPLL